MSKAARSTIFEIGEASIRAGWQGRAVSITFVREEDTLIVDMDSIESWDTGEEVTMPELQRLLELVERECEARDIEAEFE